MSMVTIREEKGEKKKIFKKYLTKALSHLFILSVNNIVQSI